MVKGAADIQAASATPTLRAHSHEASVADQGAVRNEDKLGTDDESPAERLIDYEKMEHQQIGVTRIETLWRHFGSNRPVLIALGLTIFRKSTNPIIDPLPLSYRICQSYIAFTTPQTTLN